MSENDFEYDVCLSFAGEQRDYVEQVARELTSRGVRVFFDDYEKAELWGKDLHSHLDDIYQHLCRYCILFASKEYADKVWTSHERRSAQARALKEKQEYILPARFHDTPIPGLPDTVHYIDLRRTSPSELADLGLRKLNHYGKITPQSWTACLNVSALKMTRRLMHVHDRKLGHFSGTSPDDG